MPLRPGRCYRNFGTPPYTRKEYIKSIPPVNIAKFDLGNPKGNYEITLKLVAKESGQIRVNAIEAARIIANKYLAKKVGEDNYYLKLKIYPHHILRENKMMAVAGADRLQDGMRLAFGTSIGRAARIRPGKIIFELKTYKKFYDHAKEDLARASSKLPLSAKIVLE